MATAVQAKLLLGWMGKEEAMGNLLRESMREPALTEAEAHSLWEKYQERVSKLKPRDCAAPGSIQMTERENYEVIKLMERSRKKPRILRALKVDPGRLVVYQLSVNCFQCEKYIDLMADQTKRHRLCLGRRMEYQGAI